MVSLSATIKEGQAEQWTGSWKDSGGRGIWQEVGKWAGRYGSDADRQAVRARARAAPNVMSITLAEETAEVGEWLANQWVGMQSSRMGQMVEKVLNRVQLQRKGRTRGEGESRIRGG